ncbi:MAG TPA: hypothetical protein VM076_25745 [Gemmatimonadaceae bacterium]|nr:hypothetical protein [Gemmatimonadaceae bacterium]
MTALIALGPLAATPLVAWLLIEFGPERGVIFALWWLVPSIAFAILMPIFRRRGRSLGQASAHAVAWAFGITIVVFVGLLFGFTPNVGAMPVRVAVATAQRADSTVRTPPTGSPTRVAIMDAVRAHVGVRSKFKVSHVRANDRWAFVRCTEVVDDGQQLQETDLDVAALLERRGNTWVVADLWSLSTDDQHPYLRFARRVRQRAREAHLPATLFPSGFLTSDVPVG